MARVAKASKQLTDPFSRNNVSRLDSKDVLSEYMKWPSFAEDGFRAKTDIPKGRLKKAYVLGMGGSAAGGDIIEGWLADKPGIEMAVFKGRVPVPDLRGCLAIACSASGQTEETLYMTKTAATRGATMVSISNGGKLEDLSKELGITHIAMPKALAPRYMLPFITFSCLSVLNVWLDLDCGAEVRSAIVGMREEKDAIGLEVPIPDNQAKELALRLIEAIPAIYGSNITRGVGIRFKNALNENSKKHARYETIPEAFHNDLEAWETPKERFEPVFLRHAAERPAEMVRTERMIELISKTGQSTTSVSGRGDSGLSQLLTMTYRLDVASYYVALALGRDPYPIPLIERLKGK